VWEVRTVRPSVDGTEVRGWDLGQAILREKLVEKSLEASAQQGHAWVIVCSVIPMGFVTGVVVIAGPWGLLSLPLAIVVLLALLRANSGQRQVPLSGATGGLLVDPGSSQAAPIVHRHVIP
jgi:hypothetical protein